VSTSTEAHLEVLNDQGKSLGCLLIFGADWIDISSLNSSSSKDITDCLSAELHLKALVDTLMQEATLD
jgi:hypothetical protein